MKLIAKWSKKVCNSFIVRLGLGHEMLLML
jgi:hypothetical protein